MWASTKRGALHVYFYKLHLKLNFSTQLSGYLCTISFVQILGICYLPHQYKNMCVRSQRWRKTLFVSLLSPLGIAAALWFCVFACLCSR